MELKLKPYQLLRARDPARVYGDSTFIGEAMSFKTPENTIMIRRVPGHPGTLIELHLEHIVGVQDHKGPWYVHYAIVAGGRSSSFPVDMLRFDQCVPVNFDIHYTGERHAAVLSDTQQTRFLGEVDDFVVAQTSTKRYDPFTVARWSSFLWGCRHFATEELSTGRILAV